MSKKKLGQCAHCGKEKKIAAKGLCDGCYKRARAAERALDAAQAKHGAFGGGQEGGFGLGLGVRRATVEGDPAVTVDFSAFPHLLDQVLGLAEMDIRPLTHEILFIIKDYLDNFDRLRGGRIVPPRPMGELAAAGAPQDKEELYGAD